MTLACVCVCVFSFLFVLPSFPTTSQHDESTGCTPCEKTMNCCHRLVFVLPRLRRKRGQTTHARSLLFCSSAARCCTVWQRVCIGLVPHPPVHQHPRGKGTQNPIPLSHSDTRDATTTTIVIAIYIPQPFIVASIKSFIVGHP